jgi:hypothetical protein
MRRAFLTEPSASGVAISADTARGLRPRAIGATRLLEADAGRVAVARRAARAGAAMELAMALILLCKRGIRG